GCQNRTAETGHRHGTAATNHRLSKSHGRHMARARARQRPVTDCQNRTAETGHVHGSDRSPVLKILRQRQGTGTGTAATNHRLSKSHGRHMARARARQRPVTDCQNRTAETGHVHGSDRSPVLKILRQRQGTGTGTAATNHRLSKSHGRHMARARARQRPVTDCQNHTADTWHGHGCDRSPIVKIARQRQGLATAATGHRLLKSHGRYMPLVRR
ncbi:hypothetical protein J6590_100850, partial [Homalodisca vitripennis]